MSNRESSPQKEIFEPRRVVVTGMGIVSPIGNSVEEAWENAKAGRHGIVEHIFNGTPIRVAGMVKDYDPSERLDFMENKELKRLARVQQFSLDASRQAIDAAQLRYSFQQTDEGIKAVYEDVDVEKFGVILGTGTGGSYNIIVAHEKMREGKKVAPAELFGSEPERVTTVVNMKLGAKGPSTSVSAACATGNMAIDVGYGYIQRGMADIMIVGSAESSQNDETAALFNSIRALSENKNPDAACRPFDHDRSGFIMSEGAGALIIEDYDHAKRRGAPIIAELVASVVNNDSGHDTSPGDGPYRGLKHAIKRAEVKKGEPVYVNAHATSTPTGDTREMQSIYNAFEGKIGNVHVTAPKSLVGHTMGAAGGVETVLALKTFDENVIPGTRNLRRFDEGAPRLKVVRNEAKHLPEGVEVIIKDSFGFGGLNAIQAYRRAK